MIVTGGCGFIGSHVVEELVKRGHEVLVIDDCSLGKMDNVRRFGVKVVVGRSRHVEELARGFDAIVHLGQPSSSPMYRRNPHLVSDVIHDMMHVLEVAREYRLKVIYGSSSSVYNGNPTPWSEPMDIFPSDYYSEVKYYCERLCQLYAMHHDVECIILRFFSVYGEREEHKGPYANLLTQIIWSGLTGKKFIVYGDGSQSRDLIYVKDVVGAILKALEYDLSQSPVKFEIFNVGTGRSFTVREMIELVGSQGLDVNFECGHPYPRFYIRETLADTWRMRHVLKYEPRYEVEEVVPRLIEYYKRIFQRE